MCQYACLRYTTIVLLLKTVLFSLIVLALAGDVYLAMEFTRSASAREYTLKAPEQTQTTLPSLESTTLTHTTSTITAVLKKEKPPTRRASSVTHTPNKEILRQKETEDVDNDTAIPVVPFYSQFTDITSPQWKKVGCGIASLAMIIDFYEPSVPVDTLLAEGIAAGAYLDNAGWTHMGLIGVAQKYGLNGSTQSLSHLTADNALAELQKILLEGPVMASVHYTMQPTNPIPHLVVVNAIKNGLVYYNDPADPTGGSTVSIAQFQSAWKQRYIEIRPQV